MFTSIIVVSRFSFFRPYLLSIHADTLLPNTFFVRYTYCVHSCYQLLFATNIVCLLTDIGKASSHLCVNSWMLRRAFMFHIEIFVKTWFFKLYNPAISYIAHWHIKVKSNDSDHETNIKKDRTKCRLRILFLVTVPCSF